MSLQFVTRYSNDFTYRLVQVEPVLLWRRLFGKSAHSTDDFTDTLPVANNTSDRFACFVEIGYFACQPAQRRAALALVTMSAIGWFTRGQWMPPVLPS